MKITATKPQERVEIRLEKSGLGARAPQTVIDVFRSTVSKHGSRPALCYKRPVNGTLPEEYTVISYDQYWQECMNFAKTLVHLNVATFKIVNILGFNSHEWFIANTGSILAGCIAAGIYTTNSPEACAYITRHSEAEVVVVEGNKQLEKYVSTAATLPKLQAIVVWGEPVNSTLASKFPNRVKVYAWDDFQRLGASLPDSAVDSRWAQILPGNCASLIYTSGTTGAPKAVMISHDNITWTANNIISDGYMDLNHEDRAISYLPLSHIAAQLIDIHCIMALGAAAYFAQPDALKGSLTKTMKEVKPTFFFGVPRVWEKIQEKMVQLGRESTGIKKFLSTLAKKIGTEKSKMAQFGAGGGAPCGYSCMNAIVFNAIRGALGLDQCKGCFTAAAPIAPETLWYFASLDIPVYEVFGQSECTGPHTVSAARQWKIGYCGRPIRGSETKIDAVTGELCYRGRHIFMGYMHMPEETAATIDADGFLHSGDVAAFDEHDQEGFVGGPSGFMKITGRIKELIITAGGENVPPVLIENEMKAAMVAISNVMVIGDKRKYLSMLVSLKTEVDKETALPLDQLAADALFVGEQIGSTARLYSEAIADPKWKAYIDQGVKTANKKTTSNAQVVQKWRWLPQDFSEKGGELTPTLKLKRKVVTEKYAALIESIYGEDGTD
jgi:long-chain-fatty-acid--CoA ligase ACSBG